MFIQGVTPKGFLLKLYLNFEVMLARNGFVVLLEIIETLIFCLFLGFNYLLLKHQRMYGLSPIEWIDKG